MKAWRACGCVWGIVLNINGARVWHNLGRDEHGARVHELRMRLELEEGLRPTGALGTGVTAQARDWLAKREADGARVGSLGAYRSRVGHLEAYLGELPLPDLTEQRVRRMARDLRSGGLAPATVNGVLAALGSVIRHAREGGVNVARLDMAGIWYTTHPRTDHLSIVECRAVIHAANEPWASALEVALLTGLRKGEILALSAGDVERDRPVLHVRGTLNQAGTVNDPKTAKSTRAVTLSPDAHKLLLTRCKTHPDGRLWPATLKDADKALREILQLEALGLHRKGRGWHSFRNAHTALLNESGISLRDAAARLGHGAHTAQSMEYGWAAEHVDAKVIDKAVKRHRPTN